MHILCNIRKIGAGFKRYTFEHEIVMLREN